jgi:hypothetical protein
MVIAEKLGILALPCCRQRSPKKVWKLEDIYAKINSTAQNQMQFICLLIPTSPHRNLPKKGAYYEQR